MMCDAGIVIAARVVQVVTAFFTLRILTAQLNTEEVGKTAIVLSVAMFFTLLLLSPVGNYINRQINSWHASGVLVRRFRIAAIYLFVVTSFSALLVVVFGAIAKNWGFTLPWLVALVAGVVFLKTMNMTMVTSLNLLGDRVPWAILTILTLWIGLGASWYLTVKEPNAEYWMLGQLIGFLVAGIVAAILTMKIGLDGVASVSSKNIPAKESSDGLRELLAPVLVFCIPLALTTGLNWVQFQSYRIVLGDFASLSFLGLFVAGYAISAGIIGAFESTVQQYFYPKFYKGLEAKGSESIRIAWQSYASLVLPFTLLTGFIVVILADPLTHILLDVGFWEASSFVILGALVEICRVAGNVYGLAAHGTKQTRVLVYPQLLGAISVVVMVPVAIKYFPGNAGIGVALVTASLIYLASMHIAIYRHLPVSFNFASFVPILFAIPIYLVLSVLAYFHNETLIYDGFLIAVAGVMYLGTAYRIIIQAKKGFSRFV